MKEWAVPLVALFAFALLLPIFMRLFMWWIAFVDERLHDLRRRLSARRRRRG